MATVDNRLPTEGTQIDIEARLAAIETALASLMADTTGQGIASAISGLGATLGSDKANISGDNIADPSTFRNNIGSNVSFFADNFSATIATGINLNTTIYTKALTAGIYIVTSTITFQTETAAEFKIGVNGVNRFDTRKPSGGWFMATVANVFEFSSTSNLNIYASHNVGSNVAILGNIQLVKLPS